MDRVLPHFDDRFRCIPTNQYSLHKRKNWGGGGGTESYFITGDCTANLEHAALPSHGSFV